MEQSKLFSSQASYIWQILFLYFSKSNTEKVMEIVSSMYDQEFEFLGVLDELLGKLWAESNYSIIFEIAKEALKHCLFSTEKHFYIVSILLENKIIDLCEAVTLLDLNTGSNNPELDIKVKHVIDVLWLVKEDDKDNIMHVNDDHALGEALAQLKTLY